MTMLSLSGRAALKFETLERDGVSVKRSIEDQEAEVGFIILIGVREKLPPNRSGYLETATALEPKLRNEI